MTRETMGGKLQTLANRVGECAEQEDWRELFNIQRELSDMAASEPGEAVAEVQELYAPGGHPYLVAVMVRALPIGTKLYTLQQDFAYGVEP